MENRRIENPLNVPADLLRQADAILAPPIANRDLLEQGRAYGLRFGISPLGAVLLADSEPPLPFFKTYLCKHEIPAPKLTRKLSKY